MFTGIINATGKRLVSIAERRRSRIGIRCPRPRPRAHRTWRQRERAGRMPDRHAHRAARVFRRCLARNHGQDDLRGARERRAREPRAEPAGRRSARRPSGQRACRCGRHARRFNPTRARGACSSSCRPRCALRRAEGFDLHQWREFDRQRGRGALFDVNIIPHTHRATTLGELAVGDRVNVEIDVIARYLDRLISKTEE
jgi:hypothetical protein